MPSKEVINGIKSVIEDLMESVMTKVLVTNPFIPEEFHAQKPLYAALVPDEIFKGSHFERRFVTPFGTVWEKLAYVVGTAHFGTCTLQKKIEGNIRVGRLQRIQQILNEEDHAPKGQKKRKPNWDADLAYVLGGKGSLVPVEVVCDVFVESTGSKTKYAFELKAPLPNSDQTKVSKEKMLKLMAMENRPVDMAYYALVYNPYGSRENYSWSFPKKWFDFQKDKSLLIGDEFWDLLGGIGTYENFIKEINKLGCDYKERIYRDYLKIEIPEGALDNVLK